MLLNIIIPVVTKARKWNWNKILLEFFDMYRITKLM